MYDYDFKSIILFSHCMKNYSLWFFLSDMHVWQMEMLQRTLPSVLQRCVWSLRTNTCHPHRQCLLQQCEPFPVSVRHFTRGDILVERTFIKTLPSVQWQPHRCMAGHSKFSNIKHRKEAQDHKKSSQMATYVRLAREAVKCRFYAWDVHWWRV